MEMRERGLRSGAPEWEVEIDPGWLQTAAAAGVCLMHSALRGRGRYKRVLVVLAYKNLTDVATVSALLHPQSLHACDAPHFLT